MTTTSPPQSSLELLARELETNPNFRVLRRFTGESILLQSAAPPGAGIAVVLDTETTGTKESDRIIELGMVSFAYNRETGEVYGAIARFNALEDPGFPIPPEATAVNNISDELVKGKRIDCAEVDAFIANADFIIAHNAQFDRLYCEARFPIFKEIAWACSIKQVAWAKSGVSSAKLEYIACTQGFFYEAHRAEMDCLALLNVLRIPLKAGATPLAQVLATYREESCRIWAMNSPFDAKELLKARGYRWSDGTRPNSEKAWHLDVPSSELNAELEYLKQSVYRNKPLALPVDSVDAFSRFSTRAGRRSIAYR
jgi:DNA polymerase III subunit epsilon